MGDGGIPEPEFTFTSFYSLQDQIENLGFKCGDRTSPAADECASEVAECCCSH